MIASEINSFVVNTFNQCQTTSAGHKTLALKLKNLYCEIKNDPVLGQFKIYFTRCVDMLLASGKRDKCADRVVKFLVEFTKLMVPDDDEEDEDNEEEILFFEELIERYLPGFESRLVLVRLRCVILVSSLLPFIPVQEDLLKKLEKKSIGRMKDVDTKVRVNATLLVSRFDLTEETSAALVNAMRNDPSPEVRLAAVYNVVNGSSELTEQACERVKDVSVQIRLAMFRKVLPAIDFRTVSISTRERIVKSGLNDRDEQVRKAASMLISHKWVAMCDNNIESVLQRLDVIGRTEIADLMLDAFFQLRRDVLEVLKFDDEFFKNLWVEDTVLLRCFLEFCIKNNFEALREEKMPDLTTISSVIESVWGLIETAEKSNELTSPDDIEDTKVNRPFIVEQLLEVASKYDFSDEVSRQSISEVTHKIITSDIAPSSQTITNIVKIQRQLNSSDNALVSWAFETLEDTPSMSSQVVSDSGLVSGMLRGLSLFSSILAKVKSQDIISYLPSIHKMYIRQALYSPVTDISVMGLKCLGLACLLDYKFAVSSVEDFIKYIKNHKDTTIPESAEQVALCIHAVTDMLLQYDSPSLTNDTTNTSVNTTTTGDALDDGSQDEHVNSNTKWNSTIGTIHGDSNPAKDLHKDEIVSILMSLLKAPSPTTQYAAALSLAKLTLSLLAKDRPQILRHLLVYYFSCSETPEESNNIQAEEQHALIEQQLLLFFQAQSIYTDGRLGVAQTFQDAFKDYAAWHIDHPKTVSLGDFVRQVINFTSSNLATLGSEADSHKNTNAHSVLAISIVDLILWTKDSLTRRSLASTLKLLELDDATTRELEVIKDVFNENVDISSLTSAVRKDLNEFIEHIDELAIKRKEMSIIDSGEMVPMNVPERASTPQDEEMVDNFSDEDRHLDDDIPIDDI